MIWVLLLGTAHLIGAWLLLTSRLQPVRLCDLPVQWLLITLTGFYGLPIIIGTTTGYLNTYTLIIAAAIALGGGIAARLTQKNPDRYLVRLFKQVMSFHPMAILIAIIIGLLVSLTFAAGLLLPVRYADAAGYHIVGPMHWVQSGSFDLSGPGDPTVRNYFAQAETFPNVKGILPFAIMLWSGSTAGTALTQWPFFCLLITALYALYRRLNLSHTVSLIAILFCVAVPEILIQGLDAYSDVVFFAALVSVIWIILKTIQDGATPGSMLLAAMTFAQLAGSKPVGLITCAILGAFYLVAIGWVTTGAPRLYKTVKSLALALSLVLVLCLAIAGPWYVQSLMVYGNPIYPVKVSVLDNEIFPGYVHPDVNASMVENYTKRTGIKAWWGSMSEEWRPPLMATWVGGLGAAMFIVGIPGVIIFTFLLPFVRRSRGTIFISVVFAVILLTSPAPYISRFWLPSLAFAGLAIGSIAMFFNPALRFALGFLVVGLCGYNLYVTAPSLLHRPRPADFWAFSLFSGSQQPAMIDCYPDEYSATDYWRDKGVREGNRIALNTDLPTWHLFNPAVKAGGVNILENPDETLEQWVDRVVQADATHIFLTRESKFYESARRRSVSLVPVFSTAIIRGQASRYYTIPVPAHGAIYEIIK